MNVRRELVEHAEAQDGVEMRVEDGLSASELLATQQARRVELRAAQTVVARVLEDTVM